MRKDANKIKLNKIKLKNIDHEKVGLSSGTKVFMNESLCGYCKVYFGRNMKNYFWKKRLHPSGL